MKFGRAQERNHWRAAYSLSWLRVYAPKARIKIEGASNAVGSFVGKCVHFKLDGQLHFDEGINNRGTVLDLYPLNSWKEGVWNSRAA